MSDLVERMRKEVVQDNFVGLLDEAADRIEELEAALRPFARAAEVFDGFKGSYREPASRAICSFVPENFKGDIFDKKHPDLAPITYGDCRNARAALAPERAI